MNNTEKMIFSNLFGMVDSCLPYKEKDGGITVYRSKKRYFKRTPETTKTIKNLGHILDIPPESLQIKETIVIGGIDLLKDLYFNNAKLCFLVVFPNTEILKTPEKFNTIMRLYQLIPDEKPEYKEINFADNDEIKPIPPLTDLETLLSNRDLYYNKTHLELIFQEFN